MLTLPVVNAFAHLLPLNMYTVTANYNNGERLI